MCFEKAVKAKPKAHDKGTLFYMRIIRMNNLPLQPLVWKGAAMANITHFEAQGAGIFYRINKIDGNHVVVWHDQSEGSSGSKELKSLEESKNWVNNTHYPSKMQPYVNPAPTWIGVDDRLPEMYQRVLIKADCYLVAGREPKSERNKDWGISGDWMWSIVNDNWCDAHMVTHWMPIPEFSTMQNNKGE